MDKRRNPNNTDTHKQCPQCGRVLPRSDYYTTQGFHDGLFPRCKECVTKANAEKYERNRVTISDRRRTLKAECVAQLGGKCLRCGYNEFVSGLDFHHTGDKENEVAKLITNAATSNGTQKALLIAELSKCILLCRNCHSAYHANEWQ